MTLEGKFDRVKKGILTGLSWILIGNSMDLPCAYSQETRAPNVAGRVAQSYSAQDFKRAYGCNAWNAIDESRKKATLEKFEKLPLDTRKEAIEFYEEGLIYKETHLTKKQQKEVTNLSSCYEHYRRMNKSKDLHLFKSCEDLEALKKEYSELAPWVDLENPSYDLEFIYIHELGKDRLNPQLLRHKYNLPY